MDQREEIKARLSIVDLVSQYVELHKAGRNFKGLCPFHDEKSPSFIVSPDKDMAYCFGCQKGGDIFAFYQEVAGVSFVEALKELGEKAGVQVVVNAEMKQDRGKTQKVKDIHEEAKNFYVANLFKASSEKVLNYVLKRNISLTTIKKFNLGFALDSYDSLYKHLLQLGYQKSEIVESGLALTSDTSLDKIYDRFRNRLMIPIYSKDNQVIAFGGRALAKSETVKYLNSPETRTYHKSEVLFGFNFAREEIRKTNSVILVEGYFDQIALFQFGLKNVVSISGTALTLPQLKLLNRFCDSLIFCLDADSAGRQALLRSVELALPLGFTIKVIDLQEFKDPAEVLEKKSEQAVEILENPIDFFDYFLKIHYYAFSEAERADLKFMQEFLNQILPIIQKMTSAISKDIVIRKIANALNVKAELLYDELKKMIRPKTTLKQSGSPVKAKVNFAPEDYFWGYLIWFPEVFKVCYQQISEAEFCLSEKEVYKSFFDYYNSGRDWEDLELAEEVSAKYAVVTLYLETIVSEDWNIEIVQAEVLKLLQRIKEAYKRKKVLGLEQEIKKSELAKNSQQLQSLLQEYQKVIKL